MKKLFAILAASLAVIGSASAGTALMITGNGVVIYDGARDGRNLKIYNNAAPLPPGYKRVCNDNFNRYDYRNRDCVVLPKNYIHRGNGYGYGYPPPPGYRPPAGASMGLHGHR